jgi:hypothetical protein
MLGEKYASLQNVVVWVVMGSSLSTVANVIWVINRGRKWLFWRGSFIEIGCLIVFQTLFVALVGVRTTLHAAMFLLTAGAAHLVAHVYVMVFGFKYYRDPQTK